MDKKYMIKLVTIVTVSYIALTVIIMSLSDLTRYENNYLDRFITGAIETSEGEKIEFDSNVFGNTHAGDKLTAYINLPQEFYIKDSSICFRVYNSVVHLYYGDQLLYESGEELAKSGRLIGALFIREEIPEEAWGKQLRLECDIKENFSMPDLRNVMVIETSSSMKYFLVSHVTEYIVFVAIMVISSFLLLMLIFYGRWTSATRKAIYLCAYCCVLSLWIMCNNGMYYLMVSRERYFANMEYITIYSSPLFILLYLFEEQENAARKRRYKWYAIGYAVFFVVMTVLNYTTKNYHYANMLLFLHVSIVFMVVLVVKEFFFTGSSSNMNMKVLRFGMGFTMAVFTIELVRYNLEKYAIYSGYDTNPISALSILIMMVTIAASYSIQLARSIIGEREKQYLKEMAVLDGLTGLANRSGCYEYFESMEIRNCKEYTIVYFDLNNLKPLNDNYGHDYGDKLICFLAERLQEIFISHGFCGRLGGDEFIGVVEDKDAIHVPEYINRLTKEFSRANRCGEFPMEVSVSFGIARSTKAAPLSVKDALRCADLNMYETKKRYKEKK